MKRSRRQLYGFFFGFFAAAFVAVGLFLLYRRSEDRPPVSPLATDAKSSATPCQPIVYSSGVRWICGKPSFRPCENLPVVNPSVTISSDQQSCQLVVPAHIAEGVSATDATGRQFIVNRGERLDITSQGTIKFSSDHPCVDGTGMAGWEDPYVDSPFKQNVGGLEFSIGSLRTNRYLVGTHYEGIAEASGTPVFRVIERLDGYTDNNSGAFTVTIRKSKAESLNKQIEIPANVMWFDTGIDTTGRAVSVEYVSGEWTNGGDKPIYTDCMGSGSWPGLIVKGAPFRSLVGKTAAGMFFVGSQHDVQNGKGHLFLSINDVPDKFDDNQGSLSVIIRVK